MTIQFELPKGTEIYVLLEVAGTREKEWAKCIVIHSSTKTERTYTDYGGNEKTEPIDPRVNFVAHPHDSPSSKFTVAFVRVRIKATHADHTGKLVDGFFKIDEAASTPYTVKPLWWSSENGYERAASILEVQLHEQQFVPYAGWQLADADGEVDTVVLKKPKVWRAPVKAAMSLEEIKAERYEKKRVEIEALEAEFKRWKIVARDASKEATRCRLKLAALKRVR